MTENIRFATIDDSFAILEIYSKYILETAISFEIDVPTIDEFQERMANIMATYPYLVYEVDNKVIGYAYASKHAQRAAFCYDVDVSIYFLQSYHGQNKGCALYSCLFEILKEQGYYNAYAAYTTSNIQSEKFHDKMKFNHIGIFNNAGYKFNSWHSLTWAGITLQPYTNKPSPLVNIANISIEFTNKLFKKYANK